MGGEREGDIGNPRFRIINFHVGLCVTFQFGISYLINC
jgi:hypothetical protein